MQTGLTPTVITSDTWTKIAGKRFTNRGSQTVEFFVGSTPPTQASQGHLLNPSSGFSIDEFDGDEDAYFKGNSAIVATA